MEYIVGAFAIAFLSGIIQCSGWCNNRKLKIGPMYLGFLGAIGVGIQAPVGPDPLLRELSLSYVIILVTAGHFAGMWLSRHIISSTI